MRKLFVAFAFLLGFAAPANAAAALTSALVVQSCGTQGFPLIQGGQPVYAPFTELPNGMLCVPLASSGPAYGPDAVGGPPSHPPVLMGLLDGSGNVRSLSPSFPAPTADVNEANTIAPMGTPPQKVQGVQRGDGTPVAGDGTDATGVTPPSGAAGIRGWLSGIYSALTGNLKAILYIGTTPASVTNPAFVSDNQSAPFSSDTAMTVGTAYTAGRSIGIAATAAGNVTITLSSGSSITVPVTPGWQTFPFSATTIATSTATASYYELN